MSNANGEEAPRPAKPRVGVGGYEPRGLSEATHRVATEHVLGMSFKHSFNIVLTFLHTLRPLRPGVQRDESRLAVAFTGRYR